MTKEPMNLRKILRQTPVDKFPSKENYALRLDGLEDYLARHVYDQVAMGAAIRDGIYLTDHGSGHITAVVDKASSLLDPKTHDISPHEVYLLLAAIHVHDIGNFFGRAGHEHIPAAIRSKIDEKLSRDTPEQRVIYRIADAHGGSFNGNKDKISRLPAVEPILGTQVKTRFLAALLRFADELADDMTRASRFAMETGGLPEGSEIHHQYCKSLHPITVDLTGQTLHANYEMSVDTARKRYLKDGTRVFLVDEILTRTLKMHRERIYCMRFLRPKVNLDRIKVNIKIVSSDVFAEDIMNFPYGLEEQGYPDPGTIQDVCPSIAAWENKGFNGQNLATFLENLAEPI
jgi:hypothetical protein